MYVILGPPVIDYISSAITIVEGNITTFTCNATNDPDAIYPLNIEWYKSDGDQDMEDNLIMNVTGKPRLSLQFDPVDPSHDGIYKCKAFNNPESYTVLSTSLTVECKYICMYL